MRIAVFLLALGISASLLPAVAHAQPPAQLSPPNQLSPPAEPATGSISGRIVFVGPQPECEVDEFNFACLVYLLPANLSQPFDAMANLDLVLDHLIQADAEGNFSFTGLEDGEYLVLSLSGSIEDGIPSPEIVVFSASGTTHLAVRVSVANGQSVTGIELVVRELEPQPVIPGEDCPQPLSPPNGLSLPSDLPFICAPTTGTGPGGADDTTGRIAVVLAALATLLLAGGVALRARSDQAS